MCGGGGGGGRNERDYEYGGGGGGTALTTNLTRVISILSRCLHHSATSLSSPPPSCIPLMIVNF